MSMTPMAMIRGWVGAVALTASALAGTAAPPSVVSPNIILITLDTTRADRMGFLGSKGKMTPNLDGLAQESAVFTHAYAQAPLTPVSHASILTGTYPQFHQVIDFTYPLAKDLPYAPEILRAHGYRTGAFVASEVLDANGGAPGFDRGFDVYDAQFDVRHDRLGAAINPTFRRPGSEVVEHALAWLTQRPEGPFFLWVHLYDAHEPYDPPEPYQEHYIMHPYDGAIAYEDSVVGKLLQELKARGLYDGAMIAVMADHGESLGAHGEDTHGIFLYDETIQVPLVIKLPAGAAGGLSAGKRIENRVELVDVLPTMLQAAGVEVPGEVQGQSLLGLMKSVGDEVADSWRDRPAYAQTDYPHLAYGWSALQSLRTGKYLYVQAPRRELYDETADPKAAHNLATELKAVADTVSDRLEGFREKTSSKREAPQAVEDPAAQQKLAALGYVVSTTAPKAAANGKEADPKDEENVETIRDLRLADMFIKSGRFANAVPVLQELVARNPDTYVFSFELGDCYMNLHQYDKAAPVLRKALELAPNHHMARSMAGWALGKALMEIQDFAAAVPVLEETVSTLCMRSSTPTPAACQKEIGQHLQALKNSPGAYAANVLMGSALVLSGDAAGAVPRLEKAAALQPEMPEPHTLLSDVYVQLGKKPEAEREQAEAKRLAASNQK